MKISSLAMTAGLLLAVAAAIVATTAKRPQPQQPQPIVSRAVAAHSPQEVPLSNMPDPVSVSLPAPPRIPSEVVADHGKPATNAAPEKKSSGRPPKEPLKDPDARVALSLVGLDPDAEAYWFGAINDPSLPGPEREDLIEDLNEEGFADPKHPTPDDLPLILRRLELIEMLAPYAMDQVNLDAFEEAFKDLRNLALLAVGEGNPVH